MGTPKAAEPALSVASDPSLRAWSPAQASSHELSNDMVAFCGRDQIPGMTVQSPVFGTELLGGSQSMHPHSGGNDFQWWSPESLPDSDMLGMQEPTFPYLPPQTPIPSHHSMPTNRHTNPNVEFSDHALDSHDYLKSLSKINLDLHSYRDFINRNQMVNGKDFWSAESRHYSCDLIERSISLAEKTLVSSQEFLAVITKIHRKVCGSHLSSPSESDHSIYPNDIDSPSQGSLELSDVHAASSRTRSGSQQEGHQYTGLDSPVALAIISCYVQMVELFEVQMGWVHARIENVREGPIPRIEGLNFGTVQFNDGAMQVTVFTEVVLQSLEKIDRLMGLMDTPSPPPPSPYREQGLFCQSHFLSLLAGELGSRQGDWSPRPSVLKDSIKAAKQAVLKAYLP